MNIRNVVLGGKYAISYPIGLFFLPILLLSTPLIARREHSDGTFAQWFWATVVGTAVALALLVFFDYVVFDQRDEHPIPNSWLFYLGGFIGAVKGIVTEWMMAQVFHASGITIVTLLQRSISGAGIGAIYLVAVALFNYTIKYLLRSLEASSNELGNLEDLEATLDNPELENRYLEEIKSRLREAKSGYLAKFEGVKSVDPDDVYTYLRDTAENIVRPLSKKYQEKKYRHWLSDWSRITIFYPLSVQNSLLEILVVYGVTRIRDYVVFDGFLGGPANLALDIFLLWSVLKIFVYYSTKVKSTPTSRGVVFCLLIVLQAQTHALMSDRIFRDRAHNLPEDFVWTAFVVAFIAFGTMYIHITSEELENLESVVAQRYLEVLRRDQRDEATSASLARYLHGTLQTRLITSAYRIRNLSTFTESSLQNEIAEAAKHFDLPEQVSSYFVENDTNVNWFDSWAALVNIHINVSFTPSDFPPSVLRVMREILNEALSNAYRHGQAENVWIYGEVVNETVQFRVEDDGIGYSERKSGFGTDLYNKLLNKKWALERIGNRTVFSGTLELN